MNRGMSLVALANVALLIAAGVPRLQGLAATQTTPPAPKMSEEVLAAWNDIGRRLVAMAEDFPEDKYEYKPTPEVRSFAAVLLHVAGTNFGLINSIAGKKLGPADNDPSREVYKTKAQIAALLKKSFDDGAALIHEHANQLSRVIKEPDSGQMMSEYTAWMGYAEHSGEHYGQLVVYYRLNKIVPPESRPKPK